MSPVHYLVRTFLFFLIFFFLFSFLCEHKNANKRISYFFPLRCFLGTFFVFVHSFVFWAFFFWWCFCAFGAFLFFFMLLLLFGAFWCFWYVQNLFIKKKNKEFKTTLITSFIILLSLD